MGGMNLQLPQTRVKFQPCIAPVFGDGIVRQPLEHAQRLIGTTRLAKCVLQSQKNKIRNKNIKVSLIQGSTYMANIDSRNCVMKQNRICL